jgi:hypothetical protein
MDDVFGQDIKLGTDGQALVAANGELILTVGVETGLQDIRLGLQQPLGELFYDSEFGSLIHLWMKEENTGSNRAGLVAEVETRIENDPRVKLGSITCSVLKWDETGIDLQASFEFITEDQPYNLVVSYDAEKKEMVVKDVNPRPGI